LGGNQELARTKLEVVTDDVDTLKLQKGVLICVFCRWGKEPVGPQQRRHIFPRIDNLLKHFGRWYFKGRAADEVIVCVIQAVRLS
jgi:hypothetical protein